MKTLEVERITVRKLLRPVGNFRFAASPHLKAGDSEHRTPFGEYLGITPDEARKKAEKAVVAWKERY